MELWKNIFISYASEDMGLVKSVASSLWNIGLDPIKAEDTRAHDKSSIEKIKESIRDSNVFVVIFTNNSISNQWVNQELGYAERVPGDHSIPTYNTCSRKGNSLKRQGVL
ncbi:MAG: toll/interleukin-1 receptor domain-containing protein [Candidatus Bathyarchaeia archaeon]